MKVTTMFSQSQKTEREARIDDQPAVLEEPQDHAVTRGRDESLHYEGGHSPEHHTVALENADEQQKQRTSQTTPHRSTEGTTAKEPVVRESEKEPQPRSKW